MANLTQNTTYGTPGAQNPLANYSDISKLLQANANKAASTSLKGSLDTHFNPNDYKSIFGSGKAVDTSSENVGVPKLNVPIAETQPTPTQPLPEGYTQFVPAEEGKPWVNPSDKTVSRNWPLALGGGQYAVDPTQPGKIIKSNRVIMDSTINPGAKQKVLGKLSPSLYQVDHVIPLWVGGEDTMENLQVLDNVTHQKKTAVQAVPYTLWLNGKISDQEAKLMAISWSDKDAKGLPSAAEIDKAKGVLPLDMAEKYAQKWKDDISKPKVMKYFGESFKEEMGKFGEGWLPDPIREAVKGFIGGMSAGIIPGTQTSSDSGKAGTVANTIGNIAGTILGLGKLAKGVSLLGKGYKALTGASKAVTLADEAMKTAGLATDIGNISKVASKARVERLGQMAKSAGLLSLWGQIGVTGKELTGQEEADLKNHMTQFISDAAFGSLMGSAGQTMKGYATVGLGTAALSLMGGADVEDAIKDAALMTALHGMGYKKGIIDPKTRMGNEEAYKMSAYKLNQYVGDLIPTVKVGGKMPEVLKLDIPKIEEYRKSYSGFNYPKPITTEAEAIDFLGNVARKESKVFSKNLSEEEIYKELQGITVATNQLKNQTLPPAERQLKEWSDIQSMAQKLKPRTSKEINRSFMDSTEALKNMPAKVITKEEIPVSIKEKYKDATFPEGTSTTRGIGRDIKTGESLDPVARENLNDLALNGEKYDGKIYFPINDRSVQIGNAINGEAISAGAKEIPISNPENTLRGFIKDVQTGEFKPIGYFTQPKGLSEANKYNINVPYASMVNRLKGLVVSSPDVKTLRGKLAKDKAFKDQMITEEKAQEIFDMKDKVPSMSDKEIMDVLQPANALSKHTVDNSTVTPKMKEMGIKTLIVDIKRTSPIGKGENPNDPSVEFEVTKDDFLRSKALQDAPKVTPEQFNAEKFTKVIEEVQKKQEPRKISSSAGVIKKIVETPSESIKTEAEIKTPKTATEMFSVPSYKREAPLNPKKDASNLGTPSKGIMKEVSLSDGTPTKKNSIVDEFYNDMVDRMESAKFKQSSAPEDEKKLIAIIDSFTRKNPGLPEDEFKAAISQAKSRARGFAQNMVEENYKGTEDFSTKEPYKRAPEKPERVLVDPNKELAKKYNLKLTEPNEKGIQYLASDKKGNPLFSDEYLMSHPNMKGKTPLDVYGKFLEGDWNASRASLSKDAKEWSKDLNEWEKSKNPYGKAVAKTINTIFSTKYGYNWSKSWKFNSALKNIKKEEFAVKNQEGELISEPFRGIAARAKSKTQAEREKNVAKANAVTKAISAKAAKAREEAFASGQKLPEGYSRGRDVTQEKDVMKDLTPFDIMMNAINAREARLKLIEDYNNLRIEMKNPRPTKIEKDGTKVLGTADTMELVFKNIKALSTDIKESAGWKLGEALKYKDTGLTAEQGVKDGFNIAMKIAKKKPTEGGFIKYEELKKKILDSFKTEKKDGKGGYDGQGGLLGDAWQGLKKKFDNTIYYNADDPYNTTSISKPGQPKTPPPAGVVEEKPAFSWFGKPKVAPVSSYNARGVQISEPDLVEASHILYGEISNNPKTQALEVKNAMNTAINRALQDSGRYGGSVVKVLQAPKQYQSYAPDGILVKGKKIESQYQKLKKGQLNEADKQKLATIQNALNEMKSGSFKDTTGGKTFYVHASDGTMFLGATQEEAKKAANAHEKAIKAKRSSWKKTMGYPVF